MRIAHVVASYHPAVGGLETHVKALADGCAAAGDQVTVLTHQASDDLAADEWAGAVRVLRFPLTVRAHHYPVSRDLFRYLREHAGDFDLIHAHNYHNLTGQAALSRGRPRRPLVFTPHYHGTGHTRLAAVLHQLYRPVGARLFRGADTVVCVSSAERDLVVAKFPAAAGKVTVIPNGIGPAREVPAGGHAGEREPVVLAIGRLERYKNVDLIIKAFGELPGPARLVIVGDGPDRPRLERYRQAGPGLPPGPVHRAGAGRGPRPAARPGRRGRLGQRSRSVRADPGRGLEVRRPRSGVGHSGARLPGRDGRARGPGDPG